MNVIESMETSRIRNYIIPGLDSYLLGNGKVRLFKSNRQFSGAVTPHSHRFDFACLVMRGCVRNRIYKQVSPFDAETQEYDEFTVRTLALETNESFGEYDKAAPDIYAVPFTSRTTEYVSGCWYTMKANEYHAIEFDRETDVLFFEGPQVSEYSKVLLPFIQGETIETMECDKPWMYLEDEK